MRYMLKDKLHIVDTLFLHAHSSSWYNKPTNFDWCREPNEDYVIFTDNSLKMVDDTTSKKKYAWLIESPLITPNAYEYIKNNHHKFDLIFTFDKNLLGISDKFVLVPIGGCWIEEKNRIVHNKSKLISIILSYKKTTYGHKLRHDIVERGVIDNLDIFGYPNRIDTKIEGLKDYKYSVVIENAIEDYYFTEKLIDCFITGTIPIYCGCPSIHKFFDVNGIITFSSIDDLIQKQPQINDDFYKINFQSVLNNYELAKKYLVSDDIIYNILKNDKHSNRNYQ